MILVDRCLPSQQQPKRHKPRRLPEGASQVLDLVQPKQQNHNCLNNDTDMRWDYIQRVQREHNSFDDTDMAGEHTQNKLIDEEIGYWREFATNIYPSVFINKKHFKGQNDDPTIPASAIFIPVF
jgi:hypothetical protein